MQGKNESSIREVMKNNKKIRSSFSVASQTAKVTAIARDKVLMKMENAVSLYEDFQKKDEKEEETNPFTSSRGWLHRSRNGFI